MWGAPGCLWRARVPDERQPQRKSGGWAAGAPARGRAARTGSGAGRGRLRLPAAVEVTSPETTAPAHPPSISAPRGVRPPLDQGLHPPVTPREQPHHVASPRDCDARSQHRPVTASLLLLDSNTARALLSPQRPPPLGSLQHSAGQMAAPRLRGRHQ